MQYWLFILFFRFARSNAKKNILDAIKINPKHDAAYNNLGLINMAYGNFIDAKQNFSYAIKYNPINTKAYFNISKLIKL